MRVPNYARIRAMRDLLVLVQVAQNKKRTHVEGVDPDVKGWDYGCWAEPRESPSGHTCGLNACAGGYAARYQPFIDQGLHVASRNNEVPQFINDSGEIYQSEYAMAEFFGIDDDTAYTWFINADKESQLGRVYEVRPYHIVMLIDTWLQENPEPM